jgi:hypothetical protein
MSLDLYLITYIGVLHKLYKFRAWAHHQEFSWKLYVIVACCCWCCGGRGGFVARWLGDGVSFERWLHASELCRAKYSLFSSLALCVVTCWTRYSSPDYRCTETRPSNLTVFNKTAISQVHYLFALSAEHPVHYLCSSASNVTAWHRSDKRHI